MKPLVYKKSRRVRGMEPKRHKLHVAKGDTVRVIRGEHRGKEGKILRVYPKQFRIVVEGVNVVKKHKRATSPQGESGIIEFAAPIAASNVMLLDPKSGRPTRVRRRLDKDGTAERIAVRPADPACEVSMADEKQEQPAQAEKQPEKQPEKQQKKKEKGPKPGKPAA